MKAYFPNIDLTVRTRLNSYVSPKAEIRSSPARGRGLFAAGEFRLGELVYVMVGTCSRSNRQRTPVPFFSAARSKSRTICISI